MTAEEIPCPNCRRPLKGSALMGLCPDCLLAAGLGAGTVATASENAGAFVAPTSAELQARFPELEVMELLGRGGMGAVYKARQKGLDRLTALKILPPGVSAGEAFAERFKREAMALAKLHHPRIVTLYEFGDRDGQFYFLMEFVDGVNLRQVLQGGRIAPGEALAIVPQICEALQYAHDRGVVHRDIKPENILLTKAGEVKIADFGVAKIVAREPAGSALPAGAGETEAGKVVGTPSYMAPEQLAHPAGVDHRADIYALGVVFYQMLTGELPGQRIAPPSTKAQMDVRLDEIVLRALEKDPELRWQHASVLRTRVETVAGTVQEDAAAPRAAPEAAPRRSNRLFRIGAWLLLAAVAVMTVAAVVAYSLPRWYRAQGMVQLPQPATDVPRLFQSVLQGAGERVLVFVTPVSNTRLVRIGAYARSPGEAVAAARAAMAKATVAGGPVSKMLLAFPIPRGLVVVEPPLTPAAYSWPRTGLIIALTAFFCLVFLVLPGVLLPLWEIISRLAPARDAAGDGDTRFLAKCALLVFLAGIIGPPALLVLAGNAAGAQDLVGILAVACFASSCVMGLLGRKHLPGRIAAAGSVLLPLIVIGLIGIRRIEIEGRAAQMQASTQEERRQAEAAFRAVAVKAAPGANAGSGLANSFPPPARAEDAARILDMDLADRKKEESRSRTPEQPGAIPGAGALLPSAPPQAVDAATGAAAAVAQAWLAGIDAGNYAQSWRDASALFRGAITQEAWVTSLTGLRKPLGGLVTRTLKRSQSAASLPGAPDGKYVVMQFDSSFTEMKEAVETVTFQLDTDGKWRDCGYFVR